MSNGKNRQLACEDVESSTLNSLGSTVGSFANRINRGLKEQEIKQDQVLRARDNRHTLMLRSMTSIRKALQETCKIKLGERFGFDLEISDWEGWPRVELRLIDHLAPNWSELALIVTANDHKELGVIQLNMKTGQILGRLELCQLQEVERIPVILKRAVREYLDLVGAYVLDPIKPEDLIETASRALDVDGLDETAKKLRGENMFSEIEEYSPNSNLVSQDEDHLSIGSMALSVK